MEGPLYHELFYYRPYNLYILEKEIGCSVSKTPFYFQKSLDASVIQIIKVLKLTSTTTFFIIRALKIYIYLFKFN